MNLMITGCCGQLGRELARCLETGESRLGPLPKALENADVSLTDVDQLDITDADAVMDYVETVRPDAILNCAAMTNVDGCETDPETAMRINAIGVRNLAVAAQAVGAKLLHVSTDYVFSGRETGAYVEWDAPNPATVYGKSKRLGEEYALAYCERSFIVRTSWLYGYEGKNFVKTILKAARQTGKLTVVNDQQGNPTNACDLAHHLLLLCAGEEYGVYHCTGEGVCTWYDFACAIVRLAGIPCEVAPCATDLSARPAPRPANSALDNLMLRCTVGNHMRPWQDALRDYLSSLPETALD